MALGLVADDDAAVGHNPARRQDVMECSRLDDFGVQARNIYCNHAFIKNRSKTIIRPECAARKHHHDGKAMHDTFYIDHNLHFKMTK